MALLTDHYAKSNRASSQIEFVAIAQCYRLTLSHLDPTSLECAIVRAQIVQHNRTGLRIKLNLAVVAAYTGLVIRENHIAGSWIPAN